MYILDLDGFLPTLARYANLPEDQVKQPGQLFMEDRPNYVEHTRKFQPQLHPRAGS
jgi:hypothetical protein